VKSDQLDVDSELAEVRYRIRSIVQHLSEEGDILDILRDEISHCIEQETDVVKRGACYESFDMATSLTRDTGRRIDELRELLARYFELSALKGK